MTTDAPKSEPTQPDAPRVVEVGPLVGGIGMLWLVITPTLAMYAIRYAWDNTIVGMLVFLGIIAIMFTLFRPGSPLFITARVPGIALRVALSAGVAALLVVAGLTAWGIGYAVFAAVGLFVTTRAVRG